MLRNILSTSNHVPESHVPAEFIGIQRDHVKLLILNRDSGTISSDIFSNISEYLRKGDMLIVNNSSLVKASIPCYYSDIDEFGTLNLGTDTKGKLRIVEPRPVYINRKLKEGTVVDLIGTGKKVEMKIRDADFPRYWWADLSEDDESIENLMSMCGSPIQYGHVAFPVPLRYYKTIFSSVPGSVEPPSAGIPFTEELIRSIEKKGVTFSEITLHCNLGSMEKDEFENSDKLLRESYTIPYDTIRKIAETKKSGGRVIAVGTTAVRAVESFFKDYDKTMSSEDLLKYYSERNGKDGVFHKTELFIRPGFEFRVIDGLLTGMHDPYSSHIEMMSAFSGRDMLDSSYNVAVELGYLWHEFGDLTLVV